MMHFIVILWGFTGILGKKIDLSPSVLVWYRMIIASVALFVALYFLKLPTKVKSLRELVKIILVGFVVTAHWLTFYYSISLSTASVAVLCLSTTSFHVSWLEPFVLKKPFSWLEMCLGIIVVLGIYYVSGSLSQKELPAIYIGLISAFCAALFSVFNAKLSEKNAPSAISLIEMISGSLFLFLFVYFSENLTFEALKVSTVDFYQLLFLGIFCTSFAFLIMMMIVNKLGVFTASLTINLEPIYTILMAIPLLGEHKSLSKQFYIGALLIILVVLFNGILKSKRARVSNQ